MSKPPTYRDIDDALDQARAALNDQDALMSALRPELDASSAAIHALFVRYAAPEDIEHAK